MNFRGWLATQSYSSPCSNLTKWKTHSHRATRIDQETRIRRLAEFVEPVKNQWKEAPLRQSLSSFEGFCQLIGLDKAQNYIAQRRVHQVGDWGAVELDAEGLALQAELEQRQTVCFPGNRGFQLAL